MPQTPSTQAPTTGKIIPGPGPVDSFGLGDQSIPRSRWCRPLGRTDSTDSSRIRVAKQWGGQPAARPKVIASAPTRCKLRTLPVGQHPRLSGKGSLL